MVDAWSGPAPTPQQFPYHAAPGDGIRQLLDVIAGIRQEVRDVRSHLPGSGINNDMLTSPVLSQGVYASVSGFALVASYPHTAPLTVIKRVTITVPAGFTSANVSVISRVFAYNNNTTGGINAAGGDYLLAQTGIAGVLDFALLEVVLGSGSSGLFVSPLATTLTGLTPGSTFDITIGANSDYLNWAASGGVNVATVSGDILWFR